MTEIHFGKLTINRIANNSGVFTGNNRLHHWYAQNKRNEGFGTSIGRSNHLRWNQSIVVDGDRIEAMEGSSRTLKEFQRKLDSSQSKRNESG